jgi:general secretion pathway protein C
MGRIGIWLVNGAILVLCCWLAARIGLRLLDAALVPEPTRPVAAVAPAGPPSVRDRHVILERNLFNASTVFPAAAPVAEEEDLEATKLPLRLLGTAASPDTRQSWAAVEDLETRKHEVVRIADPLKTAKVVRIERRRIVLENGSRREELALEDELGGVKAGPAAARPSPDLSNRVQKLSDNRFALNRSDVESAVRNPAALFQQARILPKYENGQMVGVQLNAIKPGSMFEQMGMQSGDTITSFNGVRIDGPEGSAGLIKELTEAKTFNVVVMGADGRERQITYEPQD